MEDTERPSHIPDRKWDACVRKSSVIVGACTLAGTAISSLFGNTAGAMYGAGLGAAWSLRKCRVLFREEEDGTDLFLKPAGKPLDDTSKSNIDDIEMGEEDENDNRTEDEGDNRTEDEDENDNRTADEDVRFDAEMEDDTDIICSNENFEEESDGNELSLRECGNVYAKEMSGEDENSPLCEEPFNQSLVFNQENIRYEEEKTEGDNEDASLAQETQEPETCATENTELETAEDTPQQEKWWFSNPDDSSLEEDVCTCAATTKALEKEGEFKLSPVSSIIPKPFKENRKGDVECENVCTCDECTCEN